MTTVRQLVPAIFVFGVFGGLLLCIISPILFILYSAVLMSYLIGALLAAKRTKSKLLFKVVRSFLILHFSYGIGYLEGILQFVILNKSPSTVNQKLSR